MATLAVVPAITQTQGPSGPKQAISFAFLTERELLAALKVARERRTRDWCMILLAYGHGLRTEEVCLLKITDLQNGILNVQRGKRSLRTAQPLFHHADAPELDEVSAVEQWMQERPQDNSGVLFTSRNGGALHRCQFFRIFQEVAAAAGLPLHKRHPRILKNSLACHLLAGEIDVACITKILGHRSSNSTLRYARAAGRHIAAVPESFSIAQLWRRALLERAIG